MTDELKPATPEQIARARAVHHCDDVQIDDDAKVSETEGGGAWVQAWVYLPLED